MPLSWNEIKHRAIAFSKEWQDETREEAEAKSFWDAFCHVFGQQRRHVASYEEPVKKLSGDWGSIDLFWPKTLLAEHNNCNEGLQNTALPKPDLVHLLGQVRRATIDDQEAVLAWLLGKFGMVASKKP